MNLKTALKFLKKLVLICAGLIVAFLLSLWFLFDEPERQMTISAISHDQAQKVFLMTRNNSAMKEAVLIKCKSDPKSQPAFIQLGLIRYLANCYRHEGVLPNETTKRWILDCVNNIAEKDKNSLLAQETIIFVLVAKNSFSTEEFNSLCLNSLCKCF